jgi:uncharacterized membrane protein
VGDFNDQSVARPPRTRVRFIRSTIVGGVLFLVPLVVLLAILGKAHQLFQKLTAPLVPWSQTEAIAGIPAPKLIAALVLLLFCFLAGLFARTKTAKRTVDWLESALLSNVPGYTLIKGMGEEIVGVDGKANQVVLARIEDAWQIAFVIERISEGHVAVYVPGAPNPMSGSVYFMTEDRIKPLDVPTAAAMRCLKRLGAGSDKLTRGRL